LHDVVHRGPVGRVVAVTGDGAVHEPGVQRRELLVAEAESDHRVRARVLDQHVGTLGERVYERGAFRTGDVEGDTALPAAALQERDRERAFGVFTRAATVGMRERW
jgi:hypothetical protein